MYFVPVSCSTSFRFSVICLFCLLFVKVPLENAIALFLTNKWKSFYKLLQYTQTSYGFCCLFGIFALWFVWLCEQMCEMIFIAFFLKSHGSYKLHCWPWPLPQMFFQKDGKLFWRMLDFFLLLLLFGVIKIALRKPIFSHSSWVHEVYYNVRKGQILLCFFTLTLKCSLPLTFMDHVAEAFCWADVLS